MWTESYENLKEFMDHPIDFLNSARAEGSKVQIRRLGPKTFILVFCPELAREILVKKSETFRPNRSIFNKIKPLTGKKGLVQLNGEPSKQARSQSRPIFTQESLVRARKIIETNSISAFDKIENMDWVDPSGLMTDLVLKNALQIFIGVEDKDVQLEMGQLFLELHKLCGKRMLSPLSMPLGVPTANNIKINRLTKDLRKCLGDHLGTVKKFSKGSVPLNFLDSPHIIDHCLTFLFAGHETSASSIAFTMLLLAKNPEHQKMVNGGTDNNILSIYKESLRLYPPAYMLVREATKNDGLVGVEVKKGDSVIIGLRQILRDPENFSQAQDFVPLRFTKKNIHEEKSFFPFGLGPKSCIGERMAHLEATVILKTFFSRFEVLKRDSEIQACPMVTLHPSSKQMMTVVRRDRC